MGCATDADEDNEGNEEADSAPGWSGSMFKPGGGFSSRAIEGAERALWSPPAILTSLDEVNPTAA